MTLDHIQLLVLEPSTPRRVLGELPGLEISPEQGGYFEARSEHMTLSVYTSKAFALATGIELGRCCRGAILQYSVDNPDEIANRLVEVGATVVAGPIHTPWGTRSVYLGCGDDFTLEIYSWN